MLILKIQQVLEQNIFCILEFLQLRLKEMFCEKTSEMSIGQIRRRFLTMNISSILNLSNYFHAKAQKPKLWVCAKPDRRS